MEGAVDWDCRLVPSGTKKMSSCGKERGLSLDPNRRDPGGGVKSLVAHVGKGAGDEEELEDLVARIGKGVDDKELAARVGIRKGVGGEEELVARVGKGRRQRGEPGRARWEGVSATGGDFDWNQFILDSVGTNE